MAESNFGHNHAVVYVAGSGYAMRIDSWGSGPFVIHFGGKSWRFEDSDQFGPSLITKNGEPRKSPWPNQCNPFWHVHKLWREQGMRLSDDGITCVYDLQPEENWVCNCVERDSSGRMTHIREHLPQERKCKECGAEKY